MRLKLQSRHLSLRTKLIWLFVVIKVLPLLLLAVLDRLEPDIMSLLWHTPMGWGVLAIVAVLETAGVLLIRRIMRIDI